MKINYTNLIYMILAAILVATTISGDICILINFSHPLGELAFCISAMLLTVCFGIQTFEKKV